MWIGLFDNKREPFHPHDVGRFEADGVMWVMKYGKQDWLMLTNVTTIFFKVHEPLHGQPHFFSFFRDEYDVEPCYPLLELTTSEAWDPIPVGDALALGPTALRMSIPGPAPYEERP
jgi:hypothetical protein